MNQDTKAMPLKKVSGTAKVFSVVYWVFAVFMGVYAIWLVLGKASFEPWEQIKWVSIYGFLSAGLGLSGVGMWQGKRWGVAMSALLMALFLVYSISSDIQGGYLWGVLLKSIIMTPAIIVLHIKLLVMQRII